LLAKAPLDTEAECPFVSLSFLLISSVRRQIVKSLMCWIVVPVMVSDQAGRPRKGSKKRATSRDVYWHWFSEAKVTFSLL